MMFEYVNKNLIFTDLQYFVKIVVLRCVALCCLIPDGGGGVFVRLRRCKENRG